MKTKTFFCFVLFLLRFNQIFFAQTVLNYGDNLTTNIRKIGEIDTLLFNALTGDKVTFRVGNSTTLFDVKIEMYNPEGVLIAQKLGDGWARIDSIRINSSGLHKILIRDNENNFSGGEYGVSLQKLNSPKNQQITYNSKQLLQSIAYGEIKAYTFIGKKGDKILHRVGSPTSLFDVQVEIYNGSGELVLSSFGDQGYVRAELSLPQDGNYTLLIMDKEGDYRDPNLSFGLSLLKINTTDLTPITYNTNLSVQGLTFAQIKAHTFSGKKGDKILHRVGSPTSLFDVQVEIYNGSGELILSSFGDQGYVRGALTLPQDGNYTLLVMDKEGDYLDPNLSFGLSLLKINTTDLTPITYITNLSVRGLTFAQVKAFTFSGKGGDKILHRVGGPTSLFDVQVEIYNGAGELVLSSFGDQGYVRGALTLPQDGNYTLLVMDKEGDYLSPNLSFGLSLLKINTTDLTPITYNTNLFVQGLTFAQVKAFTFSGKGGDKILHRVGGPTSLFDVQVEIYNGSGELILSSFGDQGYVRAELTLPQDGNYTLLVMDKEGDYLSPNLSFGISFQRKFDVPNAKLITGKITTNFDKYGQITAYAIQGKQGDTINLYLSAENSIVQPRLELYDLNGDLLGVSTSDEIATLSNIILPNSGIYALFAMDETGSRQGKYEMGKLNITTRILPLNKWVSFQISDSSIFNGKISIPESENLFVLLKKGNRIGYSGTWKSNITLKRDGVTILSNESNEDFEYHLKKASAGLYDILISTKQVGEGLIRFSTSLDTLNMNEWEIGEVLRPYGYDWKQIEVAPGQDTLFFQTEGFGVWSTLDVWYEKLGDNRAHWEFVNWGAGQHIEGEIPNPKPGKYYLRYKDSAVLQGTSSQIRQYLIYTNITHSVIKPSNQPVITSLSTYRGGNAGIVTILIKGAGLDTSAIIKLERNGFAPILAINSSGNGDQTYLNVVFNLKLAVSGEWRLKVINPDGKVAFSAKPFLIIEGGNYNILGEIIGSDYIRVGRKQTYVVKVSNLGSIDAYGVPVTIKVYSDLTDFAIKSSIIDLHIGTVSNVNLDSIPDYFIKGDTFLFSAIIVILPTGSSQNIEFSVKAKNQEIYKIELFIGDPLLANDGSRSGVQKKFELRNGNELELDPCFLSFAELLLTGAGIPDSEKKIKCTLKIVEKIYDLISKTIEIKRKNDDNQGVLLDIFNLVLKQSLATIELGDDCFKVENPFKELSDLISWLEFRNKLIESYQNCKDFSWRWELLKELLGIAPLTPEDKYGPKGYDKPGVPVENSYRFLAGNNNFQYKIDFWNAENATAPAQEVFILDTLDADFDLSTFNFNKFGFLRWKADLEGGQYFNIDVDMRPDMNMIVKVEGALDTVSRVVSYNFRALDPLTRELPEDPLAGFLPPIDSTGYQLGWVEYSASLKNGLPTGTEITNQAFVNFDGIGGWNPAPKAAPWKNTLDVDAPTSYVQRMGSKTSKNLIILSCEGSDLGSGVKDYAIYWSVNGSPYKIWKENSTGAADTLLGEAGTSYSFYSIARDNVGNVEQKSNVPDISVSITVLTEEIIEKKYFKIYPNPTQSACKVDFWANDSEEITFSIYDASGRLLYTLPGLATNQGINSMNINLEKFSNGLYYCQLNGKSTLAVEKLVIIK